MKTRYFFIAFLILHTFIFGQKVNKKQYLVKFNDPESYSGDTDSAKIMAALYAVDKVEFSQNYVRGTSGNLTIPANKTLDFTKGGNLINYTGTIIGNKTTIVNPDGHQIFSASSTLKGTFIMDYPTPEIFGADGTDDVTDHDAMNQWFQFANICKHKQMKLISENRYRIDTTMTVRLDQDVNFDGNGATIYRSYRDVDTLKVADTQAILYFIQSADYQDAAAGKGLFGDTLVIKNGKNVVAGMGVIIPSKQVWSEGKWMYFMSTVKKIIGTDTIILSDTSPFTLSADTINARSRINFYHINSPTVKNINFEYTDTAYDTIAYDTTPKTVLFRTEKVCGLRFINVFYPTVANVKISNTNRYIMQLSLCYRGKYTNIETPVYYDQSIYGISAGAQFYSEFKDLHIRTQTPPLAFGGYPSVGCKVYDSDLSSVKYGRNGNIGFDSHNSHSVEAYNCIIKGVNVSTGSFLFDSCTIYNTEYGGWAFSNRDRSTRSNPTIKFTNCKFILEDFESKPSYLFMPYINTKFFDTLGDYNLSNCIIENYANEAYMFQGDYSHEITKARNFTIDNCVFKGQEIKFSDVARGTKDSVIISQPGSFFFTNNKYDSLYFDRIPYEWYENIYISGNKPNNEKSEFIIKTKYHNSNLFINNNTILSSKPLSVSNIKQSLFFMNNLIETPHASAILFKDDTSAYVLNNIHSTKQAKGGGFSYKNSNYKGFNNIITRSATK